MNENQTVKDRIKIYIKHLGIANSKFEKECNLSNGYINNLKDNIGASKLESILKRYPELNINWLIYGEGSMIRKEENLPINNDTSDTKGLPLIPIEAIAGIPSIDEIGVTFADCKKYVVPEFESKGADYMIRVSGSSMYPKYSNGDILACKYIRDVLFLQWGKIYVIDSSQGALVKRVFQDENNPDNLILLSDNKENYPPFIFPKSDIRSLSIVVGVIRLE